jgi:ribosomal protein S18 acetylase RimI-like enzyme
LAINANASIRGAAESWPLDPKEYQTHLMKNGNFKIEKATVSDAQGMKQCAIAAYTHYIPRTKLPPIPMLYDYNLIIKDHQAFVIKQNESVIGILVLMYFEKGILLDNVAVLPEYQGKGLGKKLIIFAEKEAIEQGYSEIYLYTNERMTENINIYNHLGYIETERRLINDRPAIYMRKSFS